MLTVRYLTFALLETLDERAECVETAQTIAGYLGITRRTFYNHLNSLIVGEYVEIKKVPHKRGAPNRYVITKKGKEVLKNGYRYTAN